MSADEEEYCIKCEETINEDDQFYECDVCKHYIHKKCSELSASEAKCMPLQKRLLMYVCEGCKAVIKSVPKMVIIMEEMKKEMSEIKWMISKSAFVKEVGSAENRNSNTTMQIVNAKPKMLYSDKVASNKEVIIVKPKESKTHTEIKKDLVQRIDPVALRTDISLGKNLKSGGVVLECNDNKVSASTIKDKIQKDLGSNYDISVPKRVYPKLKIIVPKEVSSDKEELSNRIMVQNELRREVQNFKFDIFHITKVYNNAYFNILVEVDSESFKKLISKEAVNIGLYKCKIYEFIQIIKCYKCCGFNHFSKDCKENQTCPRCGNNHNEKDCQEESKRCINCVKANMKFNLTLDTNHFSWERLCPCLMKIEHSQKHKIDYNI